MRLFYTVSVMVSLPFLKKEAKKPSGAPAPAGIPTQRVVELSSEGMSEPEIIRVLKKEGYSPMEVDKAMKEALRSSAVRAAAGPQPPFEPRNLPPPPQRPQPRFPQEPAPAPAEPQEKRRIFPEEPPEPVPEERQPAPPLPEERMGPPSEAELPELPGMEKPRPAARPLPPLPGEERFEEEIPHIPAPTQKPKRSKAMERRRMFEEIAEGVVEEKWDSFEKYIDEIHKKIRSLRKKVNYLEEIIDKIQSERASEIEEIKAAIETYKTSINEISARMEGVEKAVRDSLTPMMQSVRSLSDAVKELKKK